MSDSLATLLDAFAPQSHLLRSWPLLGGISAQVTALEIVRPGGETQTLVLRQYGAYRLESHPQIAAQEFAILQTLHRQGLPVPEPYFVDDTGAVLGTPCLVMEFVAGEADFAPADLDQLLQHTAAQLAQIHRADARGLESLGGTGTGYRARGSELDDSLQEGRIRAVLEPLGTIPRRNPPVLLHGDYWPGNVLWQAGRITAVIDWEDAAIDDPLDDLSNSRMEFNWAYGMAAMQQFTQAYLALNPLDTTHLPHWDLAAALRPAGRLESWATSPEELLAMQAGHRAFVEQAFAALST